LIPLILGIVSWFYIKLDIYILSTLLILLIAIIHLISKFNILYQYSFRWIYGVIITFIFYIIGFINTSIYSEIDSKTHFKNYINQKQIIYTAQIIEPIIVKKKV